MRSQSSSEKQQMAPTSERDKTIRRIIVEGDPETLVKYAQEIGADIAQKRVTTSQIRNVFGTARQIQLRWPIDPESAYREAVLLRPKLSYFARREREGRGMEDLREVLDPALAMVSEAKDEKEREARFNRFMDFFEAIVAFHKAYGGN